MSGTSTSCSRGAQQGGWRPRRESPSTKSTGREFLLNGGRRCGDGRCSKGRRRAVDIISISLGDDLLPFHSDGLAVAAFGAERLGVFTVLAGGNFGPKAYSVINHQCCSVDDDGGGIHCGW